MRATIIGQDENDIGTKVTDNDKKAHQIELHKSNGEIYAHESDGYSDKAAKRTPEENERVEQARKYARYYVYLERGYDTVPPDEHPERIDAVRLATQCLDDDEFDALFGDLYKQLRSYHDYDTERPIPEPPTASEDVLYRQNVYLGIDPLNGERATDGAAGIHGPNLGDDAVLEDSTGTPSDTDVADWKTVADDPMAPADGGTVPPAEDVDIDAVSSLYATYLDDRGEQHTTDPETDPFDRGPDAVLEFPPIDPCSREAFREYLVHHLACQVRDCFVRMGVQPPEPFRVLGNGRLEAVAAYELLDLYPEYHDPDAEIPYS